MSKEKNLLHRTAETAKKAGPLVAVIGVLLSSSAAIALGVLSYFSGDMITSKKR